MKQQTPTLTLLCLVVLSLFTSLVSAQQTTKTIALEGPRMRAPLDVPAGKTTLQLCQLVPGEQYAVLAVGAVQGQGSRFELNASPELPGATRIIPGKNNGLRFTATAECATLELRAAAKQDLTTIPMYLSIRSERVQDDSWLKKFTKSVEAANLTVQGAVSPQSLVTNTLIGGDCFTVENVTGVGQPASRGTFANGSSSIGIQNGVVLSTARVADLPGPNTSGGIGLSFGISSFDPDLATLASGDQYDLSTIEFDFTPTASQVMFDFVFGSEEHCEFVGTEFNDVFGFFISGPGIAGTQNIAVIPGTSTPVTTNNVNYLTNSNFYVNNSTSLFSPCFFIPPAAPDDCELDGWTTVFTAVANVIPCSTYHIKLAIADIEDYLYASAVFLRANSFDAGGNTVAEIVYPGTDTLAYEACDTAYVRFARGNTDLSQPLTVNFIVDSTSTATAGVDYAPLTSPVVIPAGQSQVLVPVVIFPDALPEGQEFIRLFLDNACTCDQTELDILIEDRPPLTVALADRQTCAGNPVALIPVAIGLPPFHYLWSTGDTTALIMPTPAASTVYTVSITDRCGVMLADSALLTILPGVERTDTIGFCPGGSVVLNGVEYSAPAVVTDTLPGAGGECDTIQTYVIQALPQAMLEDTIVFCAGDTITVAGTVFTTSGEITDVLPGNGADCDTLIHYVLEMLPLLTRTETLTFCPGEIVTLDGVLYTQPGTVLSTHPSTTGCDTVVTYVLQYSTPAPSTVKIDCPPSLEVTVDVGEPAVVTYDLPTASSDCLCPGISVEQSAGLAPGSIFPVGVSDLCYTATDSCGNSASCCFQVRVEESGPCDVKVIGCMRFELLSISADAFDNYTYRIRVSNSCSSPMVYTAFELPPGQTAMRPADGSLYNSPNGNSYAVRNPNASPFHSIRFAAKATGLSNGASDVFSFTLPAQSHPNYVHAVAKLAPQTYYEAYLNTFYCPVIREIGNPDGQDRATAQSPASSAVRVFPNPADDLLQVDLGELPAGPAQARLLTSNGQLVREYRLPEGSATQQLTLPERLAEGLYFLEVLPAQGERQMVRFVVQRR